MLFQIGALAATLSITQIWRPYSSEKDDIEVLLAQNKTDENLRKLLLFWRLCLVIAAFWLTGVFCASSHIDAMSLMLAATGILFAISNWIPYALIALEISTRSRTEAHVRDVRESETVHQDDTLTILAIHNMSITIPQICASGMIWVATRGLELAGSHLEVSWIFLICSPPALIAAWMLGVK